MKTCIKYDLPEPDFWETYRQLWQQSLYRSAFQAPAFLRMLAEVKAQELAVYQFYENKKLLGAAFFKGKSGRYQFLSDLKTDHNFFIIDAGCAEEQIQAFFRYFIETIRRENWALFLDKQPEWASYTHLLKNAIEDSGLYWETSKYSVCLRLDESSPDKLTQYFNRQKLPARFRRLKNAGEFRFEVFENDEMLDAWVADYCEAHILRWQHTNTPSNLAEPGRREFLKNCLRTWISDGVLVRFSIQLDGARIAFVIGLREKNSLIFHATTYHPDLAKYSPGLVLLHLVGHWMVENNITRLDYGDGDEAYKALFSNQSGEINRIYVSAPSNLPFIVKAKFTKALRESPRLHRFYLEQVKPLAQKVFS